MKTTSCLLLVKSIYYFFYTIYHPSPWLDPEDGHLQGKKKYFLFWCNFRSDMLLCLILSIRKEKLKRSPYRQFVALSCKCYCMAANHEKPLQLSNRKWNLSEKVNICLSVMSCVHYSILCCFNVIYWFLESLIHYHSVEMTHHLSLDAEVKIKSNSVHAFLLERQLNMQRSTGGNWTCQYPI